MGKIIFFAFVSFVVLVNLCFGQEGLLKAEARPSLIYDFHSEKVQKNSQLHSLSFYASYKRPLFNSFITNALIMQAENETLQPKTSFWKQVGIYGLEFVGADLGTGVSLYEGLLVAELGLPLGLSSNSNLNGVYGACIYVSGNILLTSFFTWVMGKLLGQKGSWRKSALGSAIGCFIGIPSAYLLAKKYPEGFMNGVALGIFLITPPAGAVVGFNIK
ncbi:MAG: hypothetical protein ABIL18_06615 [candidate division WOR-3 bacterium]